MVFASMVLLGPGCAPREGLETPPVSLDYIATARQLGPVAYRDPLGAMSPDGAWLAFTEGRRLLLQSTYGGPVRQLGPGDRRRDDMAWLPDGRLAAREVSFDRGSAIWYLYDIGSGERQPLWPPGATLRGTLESVGGAEAGAETGSAESADAESARWSEIESGALRHLAWSPDGSRIAGVVSISGGSQLWVVESGEDRATVRQASDRLMYPVWLPEGDGIACLSMSEEHPTFQWRCAESTGESWIAYGRSAFSPDGSRLYFAAPPGAAPAGAVGEEPTSLDLWVRDLDTGAMERLTRFDRDSYSPSVSSAGDVLFKVQDYRTSIALAPATGGPTLAVTDFQSEIPSWNWDGTRIAFTYGAWRQMTDDIHYPDIDQHIGTVAVDPMAPAATEPTVVRSSYSEDQGMHWSPNGRWIVLHTHADGTDDVWLQPADGSQPAHPISVGGHETGWPRWSPDGHWIVYPSEVVVEGRRHSRLYLIGIDQDTGEVTAPSRPIEFDGFADEVSMAEWSPDSRRLVFEGDDGNGTKGLYVVDRDGGVARRFHRFASDQLYSGVSVSPDFEWAAFVAPAPDGHFQVHRISLSGGEPEQVTFDPSHKVHPAYSPDGERIAFTVFSYAAHFWRITAD